MKSMSKKKKVIICLCIVLVILLFAGGITWAFLRSQISSGKMKMGENGMQFGDSTISATGVTTVGMLAENWQFDFLETEMYVEEIYLSTGDEVEAGTKILKLSDESIEKARIELTRKQQLADLACRAGVISSEVSRLEAKSTQDQADVSTKYVDLAYQDTVRQAQETVTDLQSQVGDAQELVDEYEDALANDTYYTEYEVEEKRQTCYENFQLLMQLYEEWNISELESSSSMSGNSATSSTGSSASGSSGNSTATAGQTTTSGTAGGSSVSNSLLSVYQFFEEEVTEEQEEYEQALEDYEAAVATAQASLDQAKINLENLQAELSEAQVTYETTVVQAQATQDTTLAEGEDAEDTYNTTIQTIEEEYETLQDDAEEAQENLTLFEELIGDGYLYTENAGSIMMVGLQDNTYVSGETLIIAYSNPESISVVVSVDQADIASVSVGEAVTAVISEYGSFDGTVIAINPIAESTSRSSVTYSVTVDLSGDISELSANLTTTVYFTGGETE